MAAKLGVIVAEDAVLLVQATLMATIVTAMAIMVANVFFVAYVVIV